MPGETIDAIFDILRRLYTTSEAMKWLGSAHPQLDGRRPIDAIMDRKDADVLAALRRIEEDAYL